MTTTKISFEDRYLLRHDYFQATVVESLLCGIYTAIILFATHKLVIERGIKSTYRPLISVMYVLYIITIVHLAGFWRYVKRAFVDHGTSEDDTLGALLNETSSGIVLGHATRALVMFLADCIMIWRCWMLYNRSVLVVLLPLLLLFAELATFAARMVYSVNERQNIQFTAATVKLGVAHISCTLALTVLLTLLIVYRIVRMGGMKKYRSIIGIIIESSALYAVAIIVYIPFPFHPTLWSIIPNAILVPMPGIASTLVIARVAHGRGIEQEVNEKEVNGGDFLPREISTLRFGSTNAESQGDVNEETRYNDMVVR